MRVRKKKSGRMKREIYRCELICEREGYGGNGGGSDADEE